MDVFFTGIVTLLIVTAVFYIVFFGFIFYWHLNWKSYIVVPVIFTFEVFLRGFIITTAISLFFYWAPFIINTLNL